MSTYNLEPIDDEDLNLEKKFTPEKKQESETKKTREATQKEQVAIPPSLEQSRENEGAQAYEKILERVQSTANAATTSDDDVQQDADVLTETAEQSRVSALVNVAREKGAPHAFKVAMKIDDLYVLDALHDTLSGKLYEELVKEGVIKET